MKPSHTTNILTPTLFHCFFNLSLSHPFLLFILSHICVVVTHLTQKRNNMMQVQEERVVCKDHMQVIKGKRTKRQRLPSPLRLAMPSTSSSSSGGFDLATPTTTTSPTASNEFRSRRTTIEEEDDEDMANCLILLAQGHRHNHNKASKIHEHVAAPDHNHNSKVGLYLYECKTCNRCFPSFQALGGHRASHKKPKTNNSATEEKQAVTRTSTFVNQRDDGHYNIDPTSTTLTLQISNRSLYSTMATTTTTTKSKVHECSICGAEFTSGQALGGHMRRHRGFLSMSAATTTTTSSSMSGANINGGGGSHESQEAKKPKNVLKLDLNLPAPEDHDHRESNKFSFQSKEKVIVFSATSLVDCHY